MKKSVMVVVGVVLAGVAVSSGVPESSPASTNKLIKLGNQYYTPAQVKEQLRKSSMKRTGGLTREVGSAKGTFVILNAQDKVSESSMSPVLSTVDHWMRVQIAIRKSAGKVDCSNVKSAIGKAGGVLGVAVVDAEGLPALLSAPEDGWSIVNVNALSKDNPAAEVLESRVRKELLRAFAMVTGGAYMAIAGIVMRDVRTLGDLDAIPRECYGLEVVRHVLKSSSFYGLTPWRQATYINACKQGWAPAPTNEYQQAIWDKVHAAPTKPIVIKPETKNQK